MQGVERSNRDRQALPRGLDPVSLPGPAIQRRQRPPAPVCGWGFPSARPKGPPIINFRSEGRRFPVGRCLVPASHFFEFTGTKSPKTKWKFTKLGEDWFCFAGLWRPMLTGGEAFTLLTTDPSPDVAPILFVDPVFTVATDPTRSPVNATLRLLTIILGVFCAQFG